MCMSSAKQLDASTGRINLLLTRVELGLRALARFEARRKLWVEIGLLEGIAHLLHHQA
jgi:hypothetical protein